MPEQGTPEWFEAMGRAMASRKHALTMLGRWQDTLNGTENEISVLSGNVSLRDDAESAGSQPEEIPVVIDVQEPVA